MKIAVCEDNPTDLEAICCYIKNYCQRHHFLVDIDTYNNAEELLIAYPTRNYKIIFLDIVMSGLSGIEAARKIRLLPQACTIVFITISQNHALEAYSVDGAAYVVKPLSSDKMNRALDKCQRDFLNSSRYIRVTSKQMGTVKIPFSTIWYIEVFNKTVVIHIANDQIVTAQLTLTELEQMLEGEPFLRCSRSYIINMNYVESLKKSAFTLKNGTQIFIPARSYSKMQLAFGNYLTKRLREDYI